MERVQEGTIRYPKLLASYKKERDGIRGYGGSAGTICAIVCIENQRDIDYAEVVRQFIYDAYSYHQQLIHIRKVHDKERKNKSSGTWKGIRGFQSDDRLIPVLTVCVYYGEAVWNGPTRLRELMDFSGFSEEEKKIWMEYIQDYEIVVLDIRRMQEEQIDDMDSDLKLLFGLLKNAGDKSDLLGFMHKHEQELSEIQDDLYEAVASLTNTRELEKLRNQKQTEGGKRDMCKAIDDLMRDCREEGELRGRHEVMIELLEELGVVSNALKDRIRSEQNLDILTSWIKLAARAESIEAFEAMI